MGLKIKNSLQKPTHQPQISVIVPVYKAEKYLRRCVDSILAQTFKDFELLLIDDGSPDKSGVICDEYAKADSRVRVIHKENGGVSSARQTGLDNSRGEYVIHADPDDWVESDMLEELYKKAKEGDVDMVICDFFNEFKTGKFVCRQKPIECSSKNVQKELFLQKLHGACWNKLIRRECFVRYNVKFPENVIRWEDLFVICSLLMHPLKVSYLSKAFYHYDQISNGNSIVRKPTMQGLKSQMAFIDYFKKVGIPLELLYLAMRSTKELAFYSGLFSKKEVVALYPEVNGICKNDKGAGFISRGLSALICGNLLEAYICKMVYFCYLCKKSWM